MHGINFNLICIHKTACKGVVQLKCLLLLGQLQELYLICNVNNDVYMCHIQFEYI